MVFAIISVLELIYDKGNPGYFWRKINPRGWILILVAIVSIGFNYLKDRKSEKEQEISDKAKSKSDSLFLAAQYELKQFQILSKDLIIKKVDSTYINSIKATNEALAKYNLKFIDSLHAVVSKLKLNAVNPQLTLVPLEKDRHPSAFIQKNEEGNKLLIQFVSYGGTSYNILLTCYLILESNSLYSILKSSKIFLGENFIPETVFTTTNIDLPQEIFNYPEVLVFITGSFSKDPQGKIIVPYDDAFKFNFKESKWLTHWAMRYTSLKAKLNIK